VFEFYTFVGAIPCTLFFPKEYALAFYKLWMFACGGGNIADAGTYTECCTGAEPLGYW